jgi:hypothetical protein
VVVRIVTDPAKYKWMGVVGIDPFSKQEQVLRPMGANPGTTDVRGPRSRLADFPRTEFRLYASEAAARSGTPASDVLSRTGYNAGVRSEDKLETYLADRVARLRGGAGSKKP